MGPSPKSHPAPPQAAAKPQAVVVKEKKPVPPKKLNCFVMPDKPAKQGLVLISTDRVQDGCYVLGWQQQQTTWLVSEGQQWYVYANKVLKANLAFTSIFALSVLCLLFINRRAR